MSTPDRILVILPSWVGDVVMATPTLRALRAGYPHARITWLMRRYLKPLVRGCPWADRLLTFRPDRDSPVRLGMKLRAGRFDLAMLLPNAFKSALIARLSGAGRIVGYARDGRSLLLTDRLAVPNRVGGKLVPYPTLDYYLHLVEHLGISVGTTNAARAMQLFVTDAERAEAIAVLRRAGVDVSLDRPARAGRPPLVLLNPGANYGAAKIWKLDRFAQLADRLHETLGATVLISTAPKERKIADELFSHARHKHVDLGLSRPTLGSLKEIIRRCDLMITNDTGPRHMAAALDVPVVTIFGPTHTDWTTIPFEPERIVRIDVDCGPCQRKVCPLDHRCMTGISVDTVHAAALELLGKRRPLHVMKA